MESKPAGFTLRLLARLTDASIRMTIYLLPVFWMTQATALTDFIYRIVLYMMIVFLPMALTSWLFYYAWLTAKFGATPGKFLTGLKVVDENLHLLSYKRSFFRHSTGYAFSGLLFGLGFLSIIKDPHKQGWHDKAVGSKVIVVKNLWPLALVVSLSLLVINYIIIYSSIHRILTGPLKSEFLQMTNSLNPPKSPLQVPPDFELENFTEPAY